MSMHLEFEPHSWYMGFAIRDNGKLTADDGGNVRGFRWEAFTDDGNTYRIIELEADTLKDLKKQIKEYRQSK